MSEKVINLTNENYESILNSEAPVVVDFWATWCGPCQMVSPVIEDLANEFEGQTSICKLNVDEMPDIASQYKIMSIPTVMIFKNGEVIDKAVGVQSSGDSNVCGKRQRGILTITPLSKSGSTPSVRASV